MTIRLIGFGNSVCTIRVILCLKELGLSYKLTPHAGGYAALKDKDYLANEHPFGKVPVLYDDKFKITESRAICRYLAFKNQGKHNDTILIPNDIHEAGLTEQLISYGSSYYSPAIEKIVMQEIYEKDKGKTPDPVVINQGRKEIEAVLNVYDKILEGKEYLNGKFSLADLILCPITHYAHIAKHSDLWDKKPNVKKWWNRLKNRDAWKKTLEDAKNA
ncbi:glutathione S-transferase [Gigaspora margarita]|uniref:glutathione transferase n=1 Tax=Gigaspora margarita TaxID=4874 RepID=A0A8H3WW13_GIGMA|nr:glutathione S-transferase [Gigaspora margarita]